MKECESREAHDFCNDKNLHDDLWDFLDNYRYSWLDLAEIINSTGNAWSGGIYLQRFTMMSARKLVEVFLQTIDEWEVNWDKTE